MPTPPKPYHILKMENKSHYTKAEMEHRKESENGLLTGVPIKEWKQVKENRAAHQEFLRVCRLLKNIGKNDGLYEGSINRYALLKAECEDFEEKRETFYRSIQKLEEESENHPDHFQPSEFFSLLSKMQSQVIACDKQIQAKRKMMLDIEKENIMTIASSLRSIPKKKEEEAPDDMAQLLGRRA